MDTHIKTGEFGERKALEFLISSNYEILETNWRFSRAEIDIIAKKDGILVFIEVKTRRSKRWGNPEDFVSPGKIRLYMDAAYYYMDKIGHDWEIRFDVVSIYWPKTGQLEIEHYEDAFVP